MAEVQVFRRGLEAYGAGFRQTMNILLCPAQRQLRVEQGSEFAFPFHFASSLAKRGHEPTLVVGDDGGMGRSTIPIVPVFPGERPNGKSVSLALRAARFPWLYSRVGKRLLATTQFSILHHFLPFGRHTFNPIVINRATSLPSVLGPVMAPPVHSSIEFEQWLETPRLTAKLSEIGFWTVSPILRYLNRRMLASIDALVAANTVALRAYERFAPQAKHFVIPIGVNSDHFRPLPRAKQEIGSPFTFLFVGRLIPRKGITVLVEAFRRVLPNRKVKLLIAGSGPLRPKLQDTVQALGLQSEVELIGPVAQSSLPSTYAAADVVVNPTYHEPFGMVNLEAMACARAVISTDLPGMSAIVPETVGMLVRPGDVDGLSTAMTRLSDSPAATQRMGATARTHVVSNYSWDAVVLQWEQVYKALVPAHGVER